MKPAFKKRFKKILLTFLAIFCVLFLFRLAYGYSLKIETEYSGSEYFGSIASSKRNYASKEYKIKSAQHSPSMVDQKYEKIAEVATSTHKFEKEEKELREEILVNNAIIQFEQKSGNKGHRNLQVQIGVPPERFDSLYEQLIKIGKVQRKQISKKDKTNEYKELNAKKASLEKIRASLIELKQKGGQIAEYIELENRILNIESQLQDLGVNLGDFDSENEFCTVKFSLIEGKVTKISLMHRLKVALEWTVKRFLEIITTMTFVAFFAFILLWIIDRLKIIQKIVNKEE